MAQASSPGSVVAMSLIVTGAGSCAAITADGGERKKRNESGQARALLFLIPHLVIPVPSAMVTAREHRDNNARTARDVQLSGALIVSLATLPWPSLVPDAPNRGRFRPASSACFSQALHIAHGRRIRAHTVAPSARINLKFLWSDRRRTVQFKSFVLCGCALHLLSTCSAVPNGAL